MMLKSDGSRSMNIAPDSSRRVDMRPDSNEVKNVSGTHVSVCLDVLNLESSLSTAIPRGSTGEGEIDEKRQ